MHKKLLSIVFIALALFAAGRLAGTALADSDQSPPFNDQGPGGRGGGGR